MIEIDFKKLITDKLHKKGTFLNSYISNRVFFGWQMDIDGSLHQRILHPRVRRSPCLTWKQARKIIMESIEGGGTVEDYIEWQDKNQLWSRDAADAAVTRRAVITSSQSDD